MTEQFCPLYYIYLFPIKIDTCLIVLLVSNLTNIIYYSYDAQIAVFEPKKSIIDFVGFYCCQRSPSQCNATLCVVKNNFARLNHITRVIFYLAHLLFCIILHIARREYICTLCLIVLPCIFSLLVKPPLKYVFT